MTKKNMAGELSLLANKGAVKLKGPLHGGGGGGDGDGEDRG